MRVVVAADFGGSLTKVVLALVAPGSPPGRDAEEAILLPSRFLRYRQENPDLRLERSDGGSSVDLAFFAFQTSEPHVMLDFVKSVTTLREKGVEVSPSLYCTGGGISKHRQSLEACGFTSIIQTDEIQSLRRGMEVLAVCSGEDEFYSAEPDGGAAPRRPVQLPNSFILMQVGSGTNVMSFRRTPGPAAPSSGPGPCGSRGSAESLDGTGCTALPERSAEDPAAEVSFAVERVDGSAIGGASCYGLGLLLAGGDLSYSECLREVAAGDSNGVDMVVGDIYGQEGYECAGLDPTVLAASAGRVVLNPRAHYKREDALASIFSMCCLNIAHIGSLNARLHACEGIVFTGSFFQASLALQQKIRWAVLYYTGGKVDPVFVGHDAVLGCLGALVHGGLEPRGRFLSPGEGGRTSRLAWE